MSFTAFPSLPSSFSPEKEMPKGNRTEVQRGEGSGGQFPNAWCLGTTMTGASFVFWSLEWTEGMDLKLHQVGRIGSNRVDCDRNQNAAATVRMVARSQSHLLVPVTKRNPTAKGTVSAESEHGLVCPTVLSSPDLLGSLWDLIGFCASASLLRSNCRPGGVMVSPFLE